MAARKHIDLIVEYIENHLDEKLSISMLSGRFAIGQESLRKQFRMHARTTVHRFIMARRMELALRLIEQGEDSISEIARKVGYKEPSNFTNSFIGYYGYSPSEVRKNRT